jgi:hypothetical protein
LRELGDDEEHLRFYRQPVCRPQHIERRDIIRQEVEKRYFGASQKAIIFAFKDAQRRFRLYRQGVLGDRLIRQEDYQGRGLTGEGISGNL